MRFVLCFLPALLVMTSGAGAQRPDTLGLRNRQSILAGRIFLRFPDSAQNIHRGVDIMEADPNTILETRIVLDQGADRMVFFAHEPMIRMDEGLPAALAKRAPGAPKAALFYDKDSLQAYIMPDDSPDTNRPAIRLSSLLVRMPDNTLLQVDAYINPAAWPRREAYRRLAGEVFRSLEKGPRRINRSARSETVKIIGGSRLRIPVPADYLLTVDKQYDFQVIRLRPLRGYADTGWHSLTIYIGSHPSLFSDEYHPKEEDISIIEGRFLGKKVAWQQVAVKAEGKLYREQIIPAGEGEGGLVYHVAMVSDEKAALEELNRVVEGVVEEK